MKTLEITTKIGCINECIYCPQDILIKNYVGNIFMSLDQFKTILNNVTKDVVIDFTGFCEPFLNNHASQMMRHAITEGYEAMLITTMTGFTETDASILKGLTFLHVWIHEFPGVVKDNNYNGLVNLLKDSIITNDFQRFNLPVENQFSRAGNLWNGGYKKGKLKCGWSGHEFYRNVVLPNGDVYLCCMDYGLEQRLGNLYEMNYNDLDRNSVIDKILKEDSDFICRKCEISQND